MINWPEGQDTYRCGGNCNYPSIQAYIKDSNTGPTRNNAVLLTDRCNLQVLAGIKAQPRALIGRSTRPGLTLPVSLPSDLSSAANKF